MRRGAIVRLVVLGIVLGLGATAVAILIRGSRIGVRQADDIDFVFWFVTAICIAVFSSWPRSPSSVMKFRAPPDDDADGLPIHGHTGIEIIWTVVPFLLVTAMGIVSAVALARTERFPTTRWWSTWSASQFAWQFLYPPANAPDRGEQNGVRRRPGASPLP